MEPDSLLESFCDAHLLARVAKRDLEAFACFYDRTSPLLFSVARSIVRDAALAEDVLQEVYLQIWNKAESFDPRLGKPIAWAIALTRNKALDRWRSSRRRESALQEFGETAEQSASADAGSDVELRDAAAIVKEALNTLPDKQRQAIELALLQGLPHAEVAQAMQEPLGTIKAWIRRGIIEIRGQLKEHL
jgi:RNA polymerase sigma-70 factor, ECF subfamily